MKENVGYKRIHLVLNLDGVINSEELPDEFVEVPHSLGTWYVSKENLEFLVWLTELKGVKLYWFSNWREKANELNEYLGIRYFENIHIYESKERSLRVFCQKRFKSEIVLVDDGFYELDLDGADWKHPDLIVIPDKNKGMSLEDRNQIKNYLYRNGKKMPINLRL